jgi:cation/acetate symporter
VITLYYMVRVQFDTIPWLGIYGIGMEPWLGIQSTSAGVWGVAVGFVTIIVVSLLTDPPGKEIQDFVEQIRYPAIGR